MNNITVYGNITADPALRTVNAAGGQRKVADISVADNGQKDKNGNKPVQFWRVTLWDTQAENAAKYLHKGDSVLVSGEARLATWNDRQGAERASLEFARVTNFQYIKTAGTAAAAPAAPASEPAKVAAEEELPF